MEVKSNSIGKFTETDILQINDVNTENVNGIDNIITEKGGDLYGYYGTGGR